MATKAVSDYAIRAFFRGARGVVPQRGIYYHRYAGHSMPHACAVGALAFGVGQVNGEGEVSSAGLRKDYPILRKKIARCPAPERCVESFAAAATVDKLAHPDILSTMEHLFERHHWTFDQIGTWLATLSPSAARIVALQGELDGLMVPRPTARKAVRR